MMKINRFLLCLLAVSTIPIYPTGKKKNRLRSFFVTLFTPKKKKHTQSDNLHLLKSNSIHDKGRLPKNAFYCETKELQEFTIEDCQCSYKKLK